MADRRWILALTLLVSAGALDGYAWYVTCSAHPATGPHRMVWHRADGSLAPMDPHDFDARAKCDGIDPTLELAVWQHGLLAPCGDEHSVGIGWAFLDPVTSRAELRWPRSGGIYLTRALVPGPEHQLAIIYGDLDDSELFVGLATPEGWARPPESLGLAHYDAAAWVGPSLEIVVTKRGDQQRYYFTQPHSIITVGSHGTTTRAVRKMCGEPDCEEPQLVYRAAGQWVFDGSGRATTEGGGRVPPLFGTRDIQVSDVDLSEQGTLQYQPAAALGERVLAVRADGTAGLSPPLPPGAVQGNDVAQDRFELDEHGIRRRPRWFIGTGFSVLFEVIDGRSLFWSDRDPESELRVVDTVVELAATRPVARWSMDLGKRTFIPDGHGGYWLVDVDGEYIHLDHALERIDPLPLREHLRQRGSLGPYIDEPEHEQRLGWALFGLPLVLFPGACLGFSLRDRKLRWSVPWTALAIASGAYLLTGALALRAVLPLLS